MKKRFTLGTVLALMLPVAVLSVIIAYSVAWDKIQKDNDSLARSRRELADYIEARNVILNGFVGSVDDVALLEGAIRGMAGSLADEYSYYMNPEEYAAYKDSQDNPFGIGIVAGASEAGDILIEEVYEGSPAQEARLQRFDRIVEVGGLPVNRDNFRQAINMLAGEENTKVDIRVRRASDGETIGLTLQRRRVNFQAVYSEILAGQNIALVRIRNFSHNVDRDFRDAIIHLQNAHVDAIIFDVRNNPGGQIDVMCNMLGMLLPRDELLITLRDRTGKEYPRTSAGPGDVDLPDQPMVVLINEDSYSAAEFFAAALHEYEKAALVGDPTTGKGYAQELIPLHAGEAAIVLSNREYFTPVLGRGLSGVGLLPDHAVSLFEGANLYTLPHERDSQLQKAIEILQPLLPPPPPPESPDPAESPEVPDP
ncbi:MAG: S41 family peptidase [Oscillospiraceae bacterium]|nr:S41 family peptidase [Oscillospiraceae bacterium]